MKALTLGLLLIPQTALIAPALAQNINELPQWLIDFSNLPRETQQEYLAAFQTAKKLYTVGNWHLCYTYLNECEFIFNGNPHVWNLRVTCLIEQKNYDEAEKVLNNVRRELPNDETTIMNIANLHMGKGEFSQCAAVITQIIDALIDTASPELLDVLTFRVYLCYLILGEQKKAEQLVSHLDSMADTPLYYYSQAALHISKGNRAQALQDINAADNIFSKDTATLPYIRSLRASGIEEKFLSAQH